MNKNDLWRSGKLLSDDEVESIKTLWRKFNEQQLQRILSRFFDFLRFPMVRFCFALFIDSKVFDTGTLKKFGKLVDFVASETSVAVVDELAK